MVDDPFMENENGPGERVTFPDLSLEQMAKYRTKFTTMNYGTLRKHFGYLNWRRLSHKWPNNMGIPELISETKEMANSHLSFSEKPLLIPASLHVLANSLIAKNWERGGIFRVPTTEARKDRMLAITMEMVRNGTAMECDATLPDVASIDAIDIAETYKKVLRSFNAPILSLRLIHLINAIQTADFPEEDAITCIRALVYSLPPSNVRVLSHVICLCWRLDQKYKGSKKHMDLAGLSVVMMPGLFFQGVAPGDLESSWISNLVNFTRQLFLKFDKIIELEDDICSYPL